MNVELGRDRDWLEDGEEGAGPAIGTSAVQAGFASDATPSSAGGSDRSLSDIAIESLLNCHILGRNFPCDLIFARVMPFSPRLVPGRLATWFPNSL
jgi:hypothetical protein